MFKIYVLLGNPTQRPQSVLQPFRKCHETFAAEHDMDVFEAGEGQTEVIEWQSSNCQQR